VARVLILLAILSFLHDHNICFGNVKPSNILIKGNEIYLTGFGSSVNLKEYNDGKIRLDYGGYTPKYAAPECVGGEEKTYSSDVWSLGCVYLEMWTVLKGGTIFDLNAHMGSNQYHSADFNLEAWIARMEALPGPASDNLPITWIRNMLQRDPNHRSSVYVLRSMIQEANAELDAEHMFIGQCCHEDKETERGASSTGDA